MAEIEDVLAELRHRIMGPFESGPLKPARPQHQETSEEGPAMTQPVNIEQRHGSAAVALRRLAHPGRDGGVAVEDAPASEPINPGLDGGVVVEGEISELFKRLSRDMPELMEEVVAFIERRTAELDERDGGDAGKTAITLLFDTRVLARIDADAKRLGISRTAWLHVAAGEHLQNRR
jgi:hypothetical protein